MRHVMNTEEWFKLPSMHQLWLACIPPFLSVCHPAEVDHSNAHSVRIFIAALLLLLLRHRRYFISGVILVHLRSFRNILRSLLAAKWLHIWSRKFYVQPCNPFANLLHFHSDFVIFFPSDVFFFLQWSKGSFSSGNLLGFPKNPNQMSLTATFQFTH